MTHTPAHYTDVKERRKLFDNPNPTIPDRQEIESLARTDVIRTDVIGVPATYTTTHLQIY